MHPDDFTLRQAARGDHAAFERIVVQYQDQVYGLCLRMLHGEQDAMDAAQEVFIKVYQAIGRFEKRANFSTWLYRIAMNTCLDLLRKRASRPTVSLEELQQEGQPLPGSGRSAESEVLQELTAASIAEAINALPQEHRAVIVLRDVQGLRYDEIAQILSLNINTVKSRISRARQALRRALTGNAELFTFPDV